MDSIDKSILQCLQQDVTLSTATIAERIGLSTTPCWRRIRLLEKAGVIKSRVAVLDRGKLNVGVDVFVSIRTNQHTEKWLDNFAKTVSAMPEVMEFYRMSGDIDYLLRVVVPDIAAYDRFYKRLIKQVEISDVSSSFAMESIKYTTALPLEYA
ncbi:MAG: Lrp/AsnC family transcriptional regulator [Xanthomonadales bacterium]|nr:Lrp/AsnC family transcriptional regulator [Xanthomonadales bacterium]